MSQREIERRNTSGKVELRASSTGPGTLFGYAAVFNRASQNLGGFVEQVDPGAFTKSLGDAVRVLARFNHDDNYLLGTTDAGTCRLSVDGTGLAYEVDLPDTQAGRDVAVLASRGDLRFSSFAFRTILDDWSMTPDDFPLRTLLAVQLVDVAPVVTPAYMDSTAGMRSLAGKLGVDVEVLATKPLEEVRNMIGKQEGRALDAPDLSVLTQALGWFSAVDSIVDEAQEALAAYIGTPNPDADDAEENSAKDSGIEQRETHSIDLMRLNLQLEIDAA